MQEELKIILVAEVDPAIKSVQKFTDIVEKEIPQATAKADAALEKVVTTMSKDLTAAAAKAGAGLTDLAKKAPNATNTLTNLGRVISDAPFGLIGIANNIDPLLESFNRLGKATGGAGGAFKALGSALLGPAGIAVGVTAVTSALIAFGPQIGRAISGVDQFEQASVDAAKNSAEAFINAQNKFGDFVRVASDLEVSYDRQKNALDGANKTLSEYGLKISEVSNLQTVGGEIGLKYAEIKQEEAKATFFATKAAEEYAKNLELGAKAQVGDALGAFGDLSFGNKLQVALGGVAGAFNAVTDQVAKNVSNQNKFQIEADKSKKKTDDLIKELKSIGGVTEQFGNATKTATAATKEVVFSEQLALDALTKGNEQRKLAVALLSEESKELLKLSAIADQVAAKQSARDTAAKQADISGAAGPVGAIKRGLDPAILAKEAEAAQAAATATNNAALAAENASIAYGLLSPAIDGVFNALSAENPFKALIQGLKQFIVQLIKAVAQALILKAITAAFTGGAGAGAGGIGKLLGGLFGARANGGPVGAGSPYIVGEAGPELFVPQTSGNIVPNMALSGGGTLSARVSGNDLLFIMNQAGRNRANNFG